MSWWVMRLIVEEVSSGCAALGFVVDLPIHIIKQFARIREGALFGKHTGVIGFFQGFLIDLSCSRFGEKLVLDEIRPHDVDGIVLLFVALDLLLGAVFFMI